MQINYKMNFILTRTSKDFANTLRALFTDYFQKPLYSITQSVHIFEYCKILLIRPCV